MIHVPANLFDLAGIEDPLALKLSRTRRLLVTLWLVCGGKPARGEASCVTARAVWDVHVRGLSRPGRVTVVTVLSQLRDLGFVRSFDAVEGGYAVELVKEETVT
jgi:hypothetical protein